MKASLINFCCERSLHKPPCDSGEKVCFYERMRLFLLTSAVEHTGAFWCGLSYHIFDILPLVIGSGNVPCACGVVLTGTSLSVAP